MRTIARLSCLLALSVLACATPGLAEDDDEFTIDDIEETVMEGRDWIQRRRTFTMNGIPYGLTGMPIVFFTPGSGFHYGGWIEVADYKRRPYRYRVNAQWWLSTKGKRNHHLRMELPTLFGQPVGVRVMTQDIKDIGANFFGIGNRREIDEGRMDAEPDYYVYLLEQQRSGLDLEGNLYGPVSVFAGARFNRGVPSKVDESKRNSEYFVFDGDYEGIQAGWSNFLVIGGIFDNRNDPQVTTRGMLTELSLQQAFEWLGTDFDFRRITLIHTHFYMLRPSFDRATYTWVNRLLLEQMTGTVPFYELTEVGGSIRGFEIGGTAQIRGYESRRFADQCKAMWTTEIRRFFRSFRVRGQYIQSQAIAFVDVGRVAEEVSGLTPGGLHVGGGVGGRILWNSQLSLRGDVAFSPEGHKIYLAFGNVF